MKVDLDYRFTLYNLSENKHNKYELHSFNDNGVRSITPYRKKSGMISKVKECVQSKANWRSCDRYISECIADLNDDGDIIINITFKDNLPKDAKFDAFVFYTVKIGNASTNITPQYCHIMDESIVFGGRQFLTGLQLKIPVASHTESLKMIAKEIEDAETDYCGDKNE